MDGQASLHDPLLLQLFQTVRDHAVGELGIRRGQVAVAASAGIVLYTDIAAPCCYIGEARFSDGRGACIRVVKGRLCTAGTTREQGLGVGITEAEQLELEFEKDSEVLLSGVRMDTPMIWK